MKGLSSEEIARLEDLLAQERDAQLSSSGQQELADYLKRSASARSLYLKQKQLSASLHWLYQTPEQLTTSWWQRFSWKPLLAVAAMIILGVSLAVFLVPDQNSPTQQVAATTPVLESINGWVEVISPDGLVSTAIEGSILQEGYSLRTRHSLFSISSATLRYPDQSRLTLGTDTEILSQGIHHASLNRGMLHADIQGDLRIETPQSMIQSPKARCVLVARDENTKMRVEEGELQIQHMHIFTPLFVNQGEQLILSTQETKKAMVMPATAFPEEWSASWDQPGDSLILGKVAPSLQAITMESHVLPTNQNSYHFIIFQNEFEGLFIIHEDSVIELLTKTSLEPHWFNLFILTRETQPDGTILTRKYQFDNFKLNVPPSEQGEWLKRRYPIKMMGETLGGMNLGPAPPPGAVVTHVHISHPEPSRNLLFRDISVSRSSSNTTPSFSVHPSSDNEE